MDGFAYIKMNRSGCGFPRDAHMYILYEDADGDGCHDSIDPAPDVPSPDEDADGFGADCDCNDTNPEVHPGHKEIPGNGLDDDCDGSIDEVCFIAAAM